jgi:hypothetical protein
MNICNVLCGSVEGVYSALLLKTAKKADKERGIAPGDGIFIFQPQ